MEEARHLMKVNLLTEINHQSLVRFLGFIDEGNECIRITEYVPNGTLRQHLHGMLIFLTCSFSWDNLNYFSWDSLNHFNYLLNISAEHKRILDFNQRIVIALDVAIALTYLHLSSGKNAVFIT